MLCQVISKHFSYILNFIQEDIILPVKVYLSRIAKYNFILLVFYSPVMLTIFFNEKLVAITD